MLDNDELLKEDEEDGQSPGPEGQIKKLFEEIQAMKMSIIRNFLKINNSGDALDSDAMKLSQMVLKSIEMQLRILGERDKQGGEIQGPESVAQIWEVMYKTPELKAILSREAVRKRILDGLSEPVQEDQ
jgi:hypothetical protein